EGEPLTDFPVVLQEPLYVGRAVLALINGPRRFSQAVEVAEKSIGEGVTGIPGVLRAHAEIDGHRSAGRLILSAALDVDPRFRCVRSPDFAHIVIEVEG